MRRVTLYIFMAVWLAITPTLILAGAQSTCNMQACSCRPVGMLLHDHTGMEDDSCTCSMDPQNTCHIQSNPFLSGLAIALSTGSGTCTDLSTTCAGCDIDPFERLHSATTFSYTDFQSFFHPPPGYLLYCALII